MVNIRILEYKLKESIFFLFQKYLPCHKVEHHDDASRQYLGDQIIDAHSVNHKEQAQ